MVLVSVLFTDAFNLYVTTLIHSMNFPQERFGFLLGFALLKELC